MAQVMRREWAGCGCNLTVACLSQQNLGGAANIDTLPASMLPCVVLRRESKKGVGLLILISGLEDVKSHQG